MTRAEILEAAAQIFSQKGFHAASMADIAQAVNLQKGSLYHHVASKQEILLDILDQALDLLIEQIQIVLARPDQNPEEELRQAMHAYLQAMLAHRDLAVVLLLEHRSLEPAYHARHVRKRDQFERLWREIIQRGIDQGVFCCIDPALAARAVLGVMNWTITWFRPDGSLGPDAIAQSYANLFVRGLLVRPAPFGEEM